MEDELSAITGNMSATPPVTGQEETAGAAEQVMLAARGSLDSQLDLLHLRTMQGVAMAKNKFRKNPAAFSQIDNLTACGTSRSVTLKEALAWESAWENLAATWAPLPANTLSAFKTLRETCNEDLQTAYAAAYAAWRKEAEKLSEMALALENSNVAWYADATRVFPTGTPEGDMIRGTVPTTYSPQTATPQPTTPPQP